MEVGRLKKSISYRGGNVERITALSKVSLGMYVTPKYTTYKRNGMSIRRMKHMRTGKSKYSGCILQPTLGWFPNRSGNFVFADPTIDPSWIHEFINQMWNPSVWALKKSKLVVLRVPKDRAEDTFKKLNANRFWFDTKDNRWHHRVRRRWRKKSVKDKA